MSEVITAATLQRDLIEAGHNLQNAIAEVREASAEYVRVKHDFQTSWDRAFLEAQGTEQTRKSTANVLTAEKSRLHDLALERKRNARLQVDAYQSIVSAYQTIGATARAEMKMGGPWHG